MQNGTNKEQKERSAEIDQAFLLCCDIIDSPPPDYKLRIANHYDNIILLL